MLKSHVSRLTVSRLSLKCRTEPSTAYALCTMHYALCTIPFTKKAAEKNISHCFPFVSINEISVHFDQFILIIPHLKLGHVRELAEAVTGFDAFYQVFIGYSLIDKVDAGLVDSQ